MQYLINNVRTSQINFHLGTYHLVNSLTKLKLESLVKKANEKKFHIHDIEMGNLLMSNEKSTIWICGHC